MCDDKVSIDKDSELELTILAEVDPFRLPEDILTFSLIAASVDVCAHEHDNDDGGRQTGAAEGEEAESSFTRIVSAEDAGCSNVEEFTHMSHVLVNG